jgi:hypothetical protein
MSNFFLVLNYYSFLQFNEVEGFKVNHSEARVHLPKLFNKLAIQVS